MVTRSMLYSPESGLLSAKARTGENMQAKAIANSRDSSKGSADRRLFRPAEPPIIPQFARLVYCTI